MAHPTSEPLVGIMVVPSARAWPSRAYRPGLLSDPLHNGLVVVFVLAVAGAVVSLFRGGVHIHED